jgi:hypothetical protein
MHVSRLWVSGALLALSVAALGAKSSDPPRLEFMLQSGDESWVNSWGDLDQTPLRAKYGSHFAAFVRDGHTYVITNAAVLEQLERFYGPVVELGRQQAALGSKQAALGSEQARLGGQQAELGAEQAARAAAREETDFTASDIAARQRELGEKQRALGKEQRALGDQQRVLGDRQRALSRETLPKIERIFDDAITAGTAIEMR